MSNHRVVVCCWQHGHETELVMTLRQEEALDKKIPALKAVCPTCRDQGDGNQPIFIKEGRTVFSESKIYRCRHGHATSIGAFNNGMLHIKFGPGAENFVNIEGTIEELEDLVDKKEIACYHVKETGKACDCKLKPVDDHALSYPASAGIKTRTRLGDLWDRAGVEPVRSGHYTEDGDYEATRSETANRERLKRMRERNIPVDKLPGRRIDKATKKNYGRRSKNEVNPERLNGPK